MLQNSLNPEISTKIEMIIKQILSAREERDRLVC